MKKLSFILVLLLLFALLNIANFNRTSAAEAVDQQCNFTPSHWLNISLHNFADESFVPTKDTLTKVTLSLGGSGSFKFYIYDNNWQNMMYSTTVNIGAVGTKDIVFNPITVVPGQTYHLHVNQSATGSESWAYATDAGCYANGIPTMGGAQQAGVGDYYFVTYGYNAADQNQAASPQADQSSGSTSSSSSTATTTTSHDISAPTLLKAADVPNDSGNAITLNWTASVTTSIDGYRIYRSTAENSGFASIGQSSSDTPSFTDYNAKTGTKYYYFVRAYKGTQESVDSNHVFQTSLNNSANATQKSFMQKYGTWVYVGAGVLLVLIVTIVLIAIKLAHKKPKENLV